MISLDHIAIIVSSEESLRLYEKLDLEKIKDLSGHMIRSCLWSAAASLWKSLSIRNTRKE